MSFFTRRAAGSAEPKKIRALHAGLARTSRAGLPFRPPALALPQCCGRADLSARNAGPVDQFRPLLSDRRHRALRLLRRARFHRRRRHAAGAVGHPLWRRVPDPARHFRPHLPQELRALCPARAHRRHAGVGRRHRHHDGDHARAVQRLLLRRPDHGGDLLRQSDPAQVRALAVDHASARRRLSGGGRCTSIRCRPRSSSTTTSSW